VSSSSSGFLVVRGVSGEQRRVVKATVKRPG
jgi:hypothetical protein